MSHRVYCLWHVTRPVPTTDPDESPDTCTLPVLLSAWQQPFYRSRSYYEPDEGGEIEDIEAEFGADEEFPGAEGEPCELNDAEALAAIYRGDWTESEPDVPEPVEVFP